MAVAVRDTVHVTTAGMMIIGFDPRAMAPWILQCYHKTHIVTAMMADLDVRTV
ncbi:multicopper oxidase domain-containing protein [Marivita sp.]|uniref:multicopper oxidase domain-containing protein n=1 Tax=Marivita sp. TaxID=2003365 RepID=UPI003B51E358